VDWHRRRRIISTAFAVGAGLLVALAALTVYSAVRAIDSEQARLEGQVRAGMMRDLLQFLVDAETAVRGYVIVGDVGYLEPYHRALQPLAQLLSVLEADEGWRGSELGRVVPQRLQRFEQVLQSAEHGSLANGQAMIREGTGKQQMDEIRAAVAAAVEDIEKQVGRESEALQTNAYLLALSVGLAVIIALLLSAVQFALFRAEIARRGATETELVDKSNDIRLLSDLANALQAANVRDESYTIIEGLAGQLLRGTPGSLYIYSHSRDHLHLAAAWGGAAELAALPPFFAPDTCWALRRGMPLVGRVGGAALNCTHVANGDHSYLCMPIHAQGTVYGVLHLVSASLDYERAFAHAMGLAQGLAEQLSLALANIELRERLRNFAIRDGLTGLYNRRFLEEFLDRELSRADRTATKVAVGLLDIDHFKMFNDNFGHGIGDEVLKRIGAYLVNAVRKTDIVCRYGGEEIVVVLPDCDVERARAVGEKLREGIARLDLSDAGANLPRVTASIGMTVYPDLCPDRTELIASADRAMYRAKRAGRNRVCVAQDAEEAAGETNLAAAAATGRRDGGAAITAPERRRAGAQKS
jgi:diguanylate cyclase (GGDEF)-like protein